MVLVGGAEWESLPFPHRSVIKEAGNTVITIMGARTKELLFGKTDSGNTVTGVSVYRRWIDSLS